ncbi:Lsm family RNA-binding protein [Thermogladius sp. 4427co]|uniref:Lsm family RNA-binding protein n=1 Tax=Thermogladius sp. 4427co TaxID=3450718 RepID=UPI003F7B1EB2
MSVLDASRRLIGELSALIEKNIKVVLADGRYYQGRLVGFDTPSLNLLLQNAVDDKGNRYPKVIVKGERVSEIIVLEIPLFDPEEFRSIVVREMKIPEHLVKVIPEARVVEVQGRYRVSERGVEGTGPIAETLYRLLEQYLESRRKMIKGE